MEISIFKPRDFTNVTIPMYAINEAKWTLGIAAIVALFKCLSGVYSLEKASIKSAVVKHLIDNDPDSIEAEKLFHALTTKIELKLSNADPHFHEKVKYSHDQEKFEFKQDKDADDEQSIVDANRDGVSNQNTVGLRARYKEVVNKDQLNQYFREIDPLRKKDHKILTSLFYAAVCLSCSLAAIGLNNLVKVSKI